MASGVISEGVLIIASVIIAGALTGVVISKVGTFEGYYTATTEAQKEKMLTKFEIIHVSQINSTSVNVWVKNTGLGPITKLDMVDAYFGLINAVDYVGYASGSTPQWVYNGTSTSSVWSQGQTIQITLQDSSALTSNESYLVQFVVSNGVSDDYIFSVS
jgi:archaellum component FlaG (FlaF/FlaG flagellin family)